MTNQLAVGIDLGGTNTAFGIVDKEGNILLKGTMPTTGHGTVENYIATLGANLAPLFSQVGKPNIKGIGIGAPNGNFFTGEIVFAPNLPWTGIIPLARLVAGSLSLPTTLTNDAKAAAMGEMAYGAARGRKDFIMITLGTGLGSGIVANGQMIYGHDGLAGELGHLIAVRDGRKCNCGRYGCLERYASATGIALTAELWLKENDEETVLRQYQGHVTSKKIHTAADGGDAFALRLFEYTGKILGQALADAVTITSPEAIIFFGGLAKSGRLILDPVKKHLEENLLSIYKDKIKLLQSALPDDDAAILGASALAWGNTKG